LNFYINHPDAPKIISKKQMDFITQHPNKNSPRYGLGWWTSDIKGLSLSHTGSVAGFETAMAIIPNQKFGIIVLSNLTGCSLPQILINTAMQTLLNEPCYSVNDVFRQIKPRKRIESREEYYTGEYKLPTIGKIKISKADDLILEVGNFKSKATLNPVKLSKDFDDKLKLKFENCKVFKIYWQGKFKGPGQDYYDDNLIGFKLNPENKLEKIVFHAQYLYPEALELQLIKIPTHEYNLRPR